MANATRDDVAVRRARRAAMRRRWLSRRALLLHLEVAVVAPGCGVAAWWQATRALSGNELSWAYSIEWPIFSVIAVVVWWHLVHEDPEAYRARKMPQPIGTAPLPTSGAVAQGDADPAAIDGSPVEPVAARWAVTLAAMIGLELVAGIVALVSVPFSRPSGWLPDRGEGLYLLHAALGLVCVVGAVAFTVRVRRLGRMARIVAVIGCLCVLAAAGGGLLTEPHSVVRFFGIALMFVATALAGLSYLIPTFLGLQRRAHPGTADVASPGPSPAA